MHVYVCLFVLCMLDFHNFLFWVLFICLVFVNLLLSKTCNFYLFFYLLFYFLSDVFRLILNIFLHYLQWRSFGSTTAQWFQSFQPTLSVLVYFAWFSGARSVVPSTCFVHAYAQCQSWGRHQRWEFQRWGGTSGAHLKPLTVDSALYTLRNCPCDCLQQPFGEIQSQTSIHSTLHLIGSRQQLLLHEKLRNILCLLRWLG